jgi:hypothetical protein
MKNLSVKLFITMLAWTFLTLSCTNRSSGDKTTSGSDDGSEWASLFNGENLDGWYTYEMRPEPTSEVADLERDEEGNYLEPIGINNDPLNVFSVVTEDHAPAIRISGEVFGILVTEKVFDNYHLKLQFKWGDEKYPPRENELMDSGILYHSVGKEGAWGGVWMRSFECQVMEECCGDFICVDTVLADVQAVWDEENNWYKHVLGAELITFSVENSYCHKSEDYENPAGQWNTMEIYTVGGRSVHLVNGKVNNRLSNTRQVVNGEEVPLTMGKIQLQSEGAEIFYRQIEIQTIDKIPDDLWNPGQEG